MKNEIMERKKKRETFVDAFFVYKADFVREDAKN